MFEIGQTVRTKDKIPMEGVIESITPVGSTIKQINVTTKHGEFLFKDNELLAVDGVPVVKRSVDIELASLKVMRENFKKSKPVVSVLPDLRTVFDSALAKKPVKVNWVEKYKELFKVDIKTLFPSYNNGQLAMAAKKAIQKLNIEIE